MIKEEIRQDIHAVFKRDKISKSLASFVVNLVLRQDGKFTQPIPRQEARGFLIKFITKYNLPNNVISHILSHQGDLIEYVKNPTVNHWKKAVANYKFEVSYEFFFGLPLDRQLLILELKGSLITRRKSKYPGWSSTNPPVFWFTINDPNYEKYVEAAFKSYIQAFLYMSAEQQERNIHAIAKRNPAFLAHVKDTTALQKVKIIPRVAYKLYKIKWFKNESEQPIFKYFSKEQQTQLMEYTTELFPLLDKVQDNSDFQNRYFEFTMKQ